MANEKAKAQDVVNAGVGMGQSEEIVVMAPFYKVAAECVRPDEGVVWRDGFDHNVVVDGAKIHLMNKYFGNLTASSNGPYLMLHSAATAGAHAYSNLSASAVGISASWAAITFPNNMTTNSYTTSGQYSASAAATYTISGAAVVWHSSAAMATNAASGGCMLYSEGQFGTARTIQQNDTINVTVTVQFT